MITTTNNGMSVTECIVSLWSVDSVWDVLKKFGLSSSDCTEMYWLHFSFSLPFRDFERSTNNFF